MKNIKKLKTPKWLLVLKKRIEKTAGKKCEDQVLSCCVCRVWLAVAILEDFYE